MNLSQREDVKFKISKLKDWKRMSKFLKETKEELLDKRKGISYSPEMPGYHSTIFQEYNKLLEKTEDYDKCIEVYDTYIHILERAMNDLLDEKHKEVIDIYINNASDKLRVRITRYYSFSNCSNKRKNKKNVGVNKKVIVK